MELAGLEKSLYFVYFSLCACRSSLLAEVGKLDGACLGIAAPVSLDFSAVHSAFADIFNIRSPVDLGRNDECVGASGFCGTVVGNIGNISVLTCGGSTHGVCMLAYENATGIHKSESGSFFLVLVIPFTCKLNVQWNRGSNILFADRERGKTEENLI